MKLLKRIVYYFAYKFRTPFKRNIFCRIGVHVLMQHEIYGIGCYSSCICCMKNFNRNLDDKLFKEIV